MKRRLIYSEFIMRDILVYSLIIGAILIGAEQLSFAIGFSPNAPVRFAASYESAGVAIIFISALILSMCALSWCIIRRFIGSKSIYGLLMMPVPAAWLWVSLLVSGICAVIIVILFRYLSVALCYAQYCAGIEGYLREAAASGYYTSAHVESGALFTAFLRCDHLRIFLPYTFIDGARLFFLVFSLPALVIRISLSIFSRKTTSSVIMGILWICFFIIFGEMDFLGFFGLAAVSVWAYYSSYNTVRFGQML